MPVVPSFSNTTVRNERVLGWVRKDIIRVVSVQVGSTVDQPSEVENYDISQSSCNEKPVPELLSPSLRCNLCGEYETAVKCEPRIKFLLEHNKRILQEVRKIKLASDFHDIRMLLHEQPSHVSEEKPTGCIVGICISLGEFVVYAMVTSPVENGTLVGN